MNTPDAPVEVPPDCPTCDGYLVPDHYCPARVIEPGRIYQICDIPAEPSPVEGAR